MASEEKELIDRKLEYLYNTKEIIKEAIIEKGQAVSEQDTFRDYAQHILDIETGGGSDTSDATAQQNDILEGVTAYIATGKVEGTIKKSYKLPSSYTKYTITSLSKSLAFNFGLSDDFKYLADYRTVNGSATLCIYRIDDNDKTQVSLVASTTANLPGNNTNPDIKFSPVIESGVYRVGISCGRYTSVYEFNGNSSTLKFLIKTDISSYTSNSIYQLCWANVNKNIFTVIHTNLSSWGYGPVATTFKLIYDETLDAYQYTTLWQTGVARWQAGHYCFWAYDDKAFCINCEHGESNCSGYYTINSDYSLGSKVGTNNCAYVDLTNGHRIIQKSIQVLRNGSWVTTGTISAGTSDPGFMMFDIDKNLVYFADGWDTSDRVYCVEVGWDSGSSTLRYTLNMPAYHNFFGSNNGNQVVGMIGFTKNRLILWNRRTTPVICQIKLSETDFDRLERNGIVYRNMDALTGNVATQSQVLNGYKYYNNDTSVATGTMTNNGSRTYTPTTEQQTGTAGYYSAITVKKLDDSTDYQQCLEITTNILEGDVREVPDTIEDTALATATDIDITYNKTAYGRGDKIVGTRRTTNTDRYFRDMMRFDLVPDTILEYKEMYYTDYLYWVSYKSDVGYILSVVDNTEYTDLKFNINNTIPDDTFTSISLGINKGSLNVRNIIFDKDTHEYLDEDDIEITTEVIILYKKGNLVPFETNIPIYNDDTYSKRLLPCSVRVINSVVVSKPPEDTEEYEFELIDGWYESNNKDVHNSYALAKVSFNVIDDNSDIVFTYLQDEDNGEESYDFGLFSNIDTQLNPSYATDTAGVYQSLRYIDTGTIPRTITYRGVSSGNHFVYIKFKKDSSESHGDDCLKFKVEEYLE